VCASRSFSLSLSMVVGRGRVGAPREKWSAHLKHGRDSRRAFIVRLKGWWRCGGGEGVGGRRRYRGHCAALQRRRRRTDGLTRRRGRIPRRQTVSSAPPLPFFHTAGKDRFSCRLRCCAAAVRRRNVLLCVARAIYVARSLLVYTERSTYPLVTASVVWPRSYYYRMTKTVYKFFTSTASKSIYNTTTRTADDWIFPPLYTRVFFYFDQGDFSA